MKKPVYDRLSECLEIFVNRLSELVALIPGAGLLTGKTGTAILLYQYAQYKKDAKISEYANHVMDLIFEDISLDAGDGFETGLCGTAWAINRLIASDFVQADEDIFEDIDAEIFKDIERTLGFENFSKESWKGIYLLSRLQSADMASESIWSQRISEYFRHIRQILILRYVMYSVPILTCKDLLPIFHVCAVLWDDNRYATEINLLFDELSVIVEIALKEERNYGDKYILHWLLLQLPPFFNRFSEIDIPQSATLMEVNQFYLNRWIFEIDVPTPKIISDTLIIIVKNRERIGELLTLLNPENAGLGNYVGGLAWAMLLQYTDNKIISEK